ncbi:hypothetical protein HY771_02420 [Candidatus Uhrbacteria bacterium]|nr:hypothetical protein [Candidatus Uhrbacteria bacterium]
MLRVLVVILVFLAGFFVLISDQPEKVFARSSDGVIEIEGMSRRVRSVEIDSTQSIGSIFEKRLSQYYLLTPVPAGLKFEPIVRAKALEQWKQIQPDLTELSIYFWNKASTEWEVVPTIVDLTEQTLEARLDLSEPIWIAVGK